MGDGAIIALFTLFVAAPLLAATVAGLKPISFKLIVDSSLSPGAGDQPRRCIAAGLLSTYSAIRCSRRGAGFSRDRGAAEPWAHRFYPASAPLALGAGWFVLTLRLDWLGVGAPSR